MTKFFSDGGRFPVDCRFVGETTGNVKKIRGNKLLEVRSWSFGAFYGHAIVYRIDGVIFGAFNSPESFYAQKIMHVMDRCIGRR